MIENDRLHNGDCNSGQNLLKWSSSSVTEPCLWRHLSIYFISSVRWLCSIDISYLEENASEKVFNSLNRLTSFPCFWHWNAHDGYTWVTFLINIIVMLNRLMLRLSHCLPSDKTYTRCIRYADCDFMTLANRYVLPNFDFNCCQSKLCNGQKKSFLQRLKDIFS